jgi:hypothetical protein
MRWFALAALICTVGLIAATNSPADATRVGAASISRPAPRVAERSWPPVARKAKAKLPKNWRFFVAIGRCEQPAPETRKRHGRWPKRYAWGIDWHQTRNYSYPGGLGVWAPLWSEKGIAGTKMAPSADRATPIQQMIQAQRIVDRYGKYAWGCTGVALAQAKFVP